jgi:hypothetical protein
MKHLTDPHPSERFIDLNIRSKLINWSEVARRLGISPSVLYNKLHGIGRHKPLTPTELIEIENLIRDDLNL